MTALMFEQLLESLAGVPRLDGAKCRDHPPQLFDAVDDPAAVAACKDICATCPARLPCGRYAETLKPTQIHGVWARYMSGFITRRATRSVQLHHEIVERSLWAACICWPTRVRTPGDPDSYARPDIYTWPFVGWGVKSVARITGTTAESKFYRPQREVTTFSGPFTANMPLTCVNTERFGTISGKFPVLIKGFSACRLAHRLVHA